MTDRDRILGLLEEIHSLVEENGNADGTLRFDALRAIVALDFAKTEIEKMISGQIPQGIPKLQGPCGMLSCRGNSLSRIPGRQTFCFAP